ncbi:MAG: homoserine O-acetyltransferase [Muribaculaceae bacterium]|nr:homoserine O-acetyltransferase [Muribaculaceae bacterium]
MRKYYHHNHPLKLETGTTLPELTIAYHTFGKMNADRSNVVWVMHALTADSNVADWWPHTVEKGRFLDPDKWFVVCANVLGSCYGTTGPTSINPQNGTQYLGDFPDVTVRDMVNCHRLLAKHLGIDRINTIVGSSLGGFQAIEWLVSEPEIAGRAILIATDYRCRPWLAAINKAMYMAIEADQTYGTRSTSAGAKGLAAARAIGLLSYRGQAAYDKTQEDKEPHDIFNRRVHGYQEHQGEKLCNRFDAYSYTKMCRSTDSHDVGRGRGSYEEALRRIKAKCMVVAISSDILFPPSYHKEMTEMIPDAEYKEIDSEYAHDGFLIEYEKLDKIISDFYSHSTID